MEPFNIQIDADSNQITLTLLPTNEGYVKVIYYGGILGAISFNKQLKEWTLVPPNEVEAGDLPPYSEKMEEDHVKIELDSETIVKIGQQIEKSGNFNK